MKIKFHIKKLLSICFLFFLTPYPLSLIPDAHADVPDYINYQGRLRQNGQPMNGDVDIKFSIYRDSNGSNLLWSEDATVRLSTGIYNHKLGTGSPDFDIWPEIDWTVSGRDYYLGVNVENGGNLLPLMKFEAVPFSFVARQLCGYNIITTTDSYVGIGLTNPGEALHVSGNIQVTGTVDGVDISANAPTWGADTSASNEIQTLSFSGNDVTLSNGGGNVTAPYATSAVDADTVDSQDYNSNWPTTLATIQSVCSNDFHNLNGTDDDVAETDAKVPDNITIDNGVINATVGESSVTVTGSLNIPGQVVCIVKRSDTLTVNGDETVEFDAEEKDEYGMHSPGSSNVVIPTGQSGYYLITVNMVFTWNTSGTRRLEVKVDGTTELYTQKGADSWAENPVTVSKILKLDGGDVITVVLNSSVETTIMNSTENYLCVQKLN